jgi:hypothetical protein
MKLKIDSLRFNIDRALCGICSNFSRSNFRSCCLFLGGVFRFVVVGLHLVSVTAMEACHKKAIVLQTNN